MGSFLLVIAITFCLSPIWRKADGLSCFSATGTSPNLPSSAENSTNCMACSKGVARFDSTPVYTWSCVETLSCKDTVSFSTYHDSSFYNGYCLCCTDNCNAADAYSCEAVNNLQLHYADYTEPPSSEPISCYNYTSNDPNLPANAQIVEGCQACTKTFKLVQDGYVFTYTYQWGCSDLGRVTGDYSDDNDCKSGKTEDYYTAGTLYNAQCICCTSKCNDALFKCGKEAILASSGVLVSCYNYTSTSPNLPSNAPIVPFCGACTKKVARLSGMDVYKWNCAANTPFVNSASNAAARCTDVATSMADVDRTVFYSYCGCCSDKCNNETYKCGLEEMQLTSAATSVSSSNLISCFDYSSNNPILPSNAPVTKGCRLCTKSFLSSLTSGIYQWSCSQSSLLDGLRDSTSCKESKAESYFTNGTMYTAECSCCSANCNDASFKCGPESPTLRPLQLLSCYSYTSTDPNLPSSAPIITACRACWKKLMRTTTGTMAVWGCDPAGPANEVACTDVALTGTYTDNTAGVAYCTCCGSKCNGPSFKCGNETPLPASNSSVMGSTEQISCYNHSSSDHNLPSNAPIVSGCAACTKSFSKINGSQTYSWNCNKDYLLPASTSCREGKMEVYYMNRTAYSVYCGCCSNNCNNVYVCSSDSAYGTGFPSAITKNGAANPLTSQLILIAGFLMTLLLF